jgi:hypothetical protein
MTTQKTYIFTCMTNQLDTKEVWHRVTVMHRLNYEQLIVVTSLNITGQYDTPYNRQDIPILGYKKVSKNKVYFVAYSIRNSFAKLVRAWWRYSFITYQAADTSAFCCCSNNCGSVVFTSWIL